MQAAFQEGSLNKACVWQIDVLIPKWGGKDF